MILRLFPFSLGDGGIAVELALKGLTSSLTDGYAMLMSPRQSETAVHGCHCPRDMAVRMREVMARPWIGVCVPLALIST